jgi:hypothetical protein
MSDHQLSTRDLAAGSGRDEDAPSTRERDSEPESAQLDEPLMRDQAAESDELGEPVTVDAEREPLLPTDQSERFTTRWQEIQSSFVDKPRDAVAEADALVADLMQRLAASFSNERERLEGQWDQGDDVSTEDLRVALTRYRSFFDRLLSA